MALDQLAVVALIANDLPGHVGTLFDVRSWKVNGRGAAPKKATTVVSTSGVANMDLDRFIREHIERVVNQHDMSAVDEMVSPDYTRGGYGWPEDIAAARVLRPAEPNST